MKHAVFLMSVFSGSMVQGGCVEFGVGGLGSGFRALGGSELRVLESRVSG